MAEHKTVHGIRASKNSIIVFDEVDVAMVVEKDVNATKVPLPVLIRDVNGKTMEEIHLQVQSAVKQAVNDEGSLFSVV